MINFIVNFLSDRRISVRINGYMSDDYTVENGVPQGGILSVTLFLVAINSITEIIEAPATCTLYADDPTFLIKGKNLKTIREIGQRLLNKLHEFEEQTGSEVSKIKTVVLLFSKTNCTEDIELFLDGHKLQVVNSTRILGTIFDSKMDWALHIKYLKKDCTRRLNVLKI